MHILNESVRTIKGVGQKYSELFLKNGISTIEDLVMYFPRSYDFIEDNSQKCVFEGNVSQILRDVSPRKNLVITQIILKNNFGENANLIYFNKPYMKHSFIVGRKYRVYGSFKRSKNYIEISNAQKFDDIKSSTISKYKSIKGISNSCISNLINSVLSKLSFDENLPIEIIRRRNLISLRDAINNIHSPNNKEYLEASIKRFKYQELMYFFMKTYFLKDRFALKKEGIKFKIFTNELIRLKQSLGFTLTNDQNKVIREILLEQKTGTLINRLLQGDVGSGKTIVVFITSFNILLNNYKVCMIVPTEILAMQHYKDALKLFGDFDIKVKLLTGSTKEKDKKLIKEELKGDNPIFVIGTHAILEDDVVINKLGYIIFDEQHRFGVSQRFKLVHKSENGNCNILVMTATPIPRTLFLYLYNGMDISTIKELPSNRKEVKTIHIKQEYSDSVYRILKEEIDKGGQCYVVCPMIEDNDKMDLSSVECLYEEFNTSILSSYNISFLHGKMDNKLKNEIMEQFKEGLIDILISTTVVEVGISVSNATVMVIQNAERFGLSQIHQLRGRIGRGSKEGICLLVTKSMNAVTQKRISTLVSSNDGFYLSEQDLKIRGIGDVFGYNQHGDTGFVFANVIDDIDILRYVREDIDYMKNLDSESVNNFYQNVQKKLDNIDKTICFN